VKPLREYLDTIRVEHTLFALPFAYATLFLVERGWPTRHSFEWITLAMVAGRTVGMAANRLIDAEVDAHNPRTAGRAIPAGRLSVRSAAGFTGVALAIFLVAVWQLASVCRWLWPVAIGAMIAYPYAKRFTRFAHFFLGAVYVMIPTAVWLAVTGTLPPAALLLGLGAGLWVAGFDIIYACQDAEHDRGSGLHSLPADLGIAPALAIARWLHVGFVISLLAAGIMLDAGRWYYVAVLISAVTLMFEHRLVKADDLSRVNAAFFTANGIVSVVLFVFIALDTVI
jgi:4-hydroxybenzoate polyprenyltransferase